MYFYLMRIDTHVNLKPYHTFGIDTHASQFTRIQHRAELNLVLQFYTQYQPLLILGGGSNVLFTTVSYTHLRAHET